MNKENIVKVISMWTYDSIDISENFDEWMDFLKKEKIFYTYEEMCEINQDIFNDNNIMEYYCDIEDKDEIMNHYINGYDEQILNLDENLYFYQGYIDEHIIDKFFKEHKDIKRPNKIKYNSIKEAIIKLTKEWTSDNIDVSKYWKKWYKFLQTKGYIKTYQEIYDMDLAYLQCNKDYDFWINGEWDVDLLINNDNDIEQIDNNLYFYHHQELIDEDIIDEFYEQYI